MNKLLAIALTSIMAPAMATVDNGGFEQWSGGNPDSWTTIDSGISVTQSNTAYAGGASAAVNVTTGTQSSTDFRQTVSVTAGEDYEFGVWIRHTEGGVRARLYVNGYQGYSTASLTNQWQQLSHSYTATSSGSIEVGLRFYDQLGFDGEELVYVDQFEPTNSNSGGSSGGDNSDENSDVCVYGTVDLTIDRWGGETSWEITASGSTAAEGDNYSAYTSYSEAICLASGDYTFTIFDSYGDGLCCSYGDGSYSVVVGGSTVAAGGSFGSQESTNFTVGSGSSGNNGGGSNTGGSINQSAYYQGVDGLSGYALKTALHNIINGHSNQGYSALWTFYSQNSRDSYFENDNSILDIYSENPNGSDPYTFSGTSDQCGNYSSEGDCYNREHSFPRSWFGGSVEPMNSDVHHIFASDGKVNSVRGSYPYGEVSTSSYTAGNGSKLGNHNGSGYNSTVFEPIDEFKGDLARAYFYMATRYEDAIDGWQNNSSYSDAVLNGTDSSVYESWFLSLLKQWHAQDPVSQLELDRNDAAYNYQGNRNPFIDNPQWVSEIWGS